MMRVPESQRKTESKRSASRVASPPRPSRSCVWRAVRRWRRGADLPGRLGLVLDSAGIALLHDLERHGPGSAGAPASSTDAARARPDSDGVEVRGGPGGGRERARRAASRRRPRGLRDRRADAGEPEGVCRAPPGRDQGGCPRRGTGGIPRGVQVDALVRGGRAAVDLAPPHRRQRGAHEAPQPAPAAGGLHRRPAASLSRRRMLDRRAGAMGRAERGRARGRRASVRSCAGPSSRLRRAPGRCSCYADIEELDTDETATALGTTRNAVKIRPAPGPSGAEDVASTASSSAPSCTARLDRALPTVEAGTMPGTTSMIGSPRPLYVPVILGTMRQGRMSLTSPACCRPSCRGAGDRDRADRRRPLPQRVDDAGEARRRIRGFAERDDARRRAGDRVARVQPRLLGHAQTHARHLPQGVHPQGGRRGGRVGQGRGAERAASRICCRCCASWGS